MTEENQKDLLFFQINILKMHLAVPKHNVLVIIHKISDQCLYPINWIVYWRYLINTCNFIVYCFQSSIFDEIELTDLSVAECSTKNINHSFQVRTLVYTYKYSW